MVELVAVAFFCISVSPLRLLRISRESTLKQSLLTPTTPLVLADGILYWVDRCVVHAGGIQDSFWSCRLAAPEFGLLPAVSGSFAYVKYC